MYLSDCIHNNLTSFCIFFFNDTATTEIYTYGHTLSLHDALPIYRQAVPCDRQALWRRTDGDGDDCQPSHGSRDSAVAAKRSEEHTSELQSLMRISYAVFCLKKKKTKNLLDAYKSKYDHSLNKHSSRRQPM